MMEANRIFIVPFSHLDLFWAGTREECLSRGSVIIRTALDLLEICPEYRFMIESVNFVEYYLAVHPGEKARICSLLAEKRLEIIPMRAITYQQLPSGETLVRNFLSGIRFCREEFGRSGIVATLSDVPGVTPQMPQIALKCGMHSLYLSHGTPPHTNHILYAALDGSTIQAYAPVHYARCRSLLGHGNDYTEMIAAEGELEACFGSFGYDQVCQWGVDLCVIGREVVENILHWNRQGRRPLVFSTLAEFFEQPRSGETRTVSGEIPSLWPNVESSWPDLWPLDLACENAMFTAEFFGALLPERYNPAFMRKAWDWLLDAMDHNQNGIGGAAADRDKLELKLAARQLADRFSAEAAAILAARATAPGENAFPVVVFNPLGWRRSETVRGRTAIYGPGSAKSGLLNGNNFRLIDAAGNERPFHLVNHLCGIADSIEIDFFADDVPAFGAKVYYLQVAEPEPRQSPFLIDDGETRDRIDPRIPAGCNRYENHAIRLEIDRVSGEWNLFDRKTGRRVIRNAGLLGLEEARGDYICRMELTGRTVPAVVRAIRLTENNAVFCRIALEGSVYDQEFTQTITLHADSSIVDVENRIRWKGGAYVRLEQAFPFDSGEEAAIDYGVPFGRVRYPETIYRDGLSFEQIVTPERGDDPDDAINRIRLVSGWLRISDSQSGVTIGCDHRMWEFDGNTVRNCMLRGIGYASGAVGILPDGSQRAEPRPPAGEYVFRYRLEPSSGEQPDGGRCGRELNAPLRIVGSGACNTAAVPGLPLPAMPDCTGTGIVIGNVKPAEGNPGELVFRAFEAAGRADSLLLPEIPEKSWQEANLLEEERHPCSGGRLEFRPYEIKTLILSPGKGC